MGSIKLPLKLNLDLQNSSIENASNVGDSPIYYAANRPATSVDFADGTIFVADDGISVSNAADGWTDIASGTGGTGGYSFPYQITAATALTENFVIGNVGDTELEPVSGTADQIAAIEYFIADSSWTVTATFGSYPTVDIIGFEPNNEVSTQVSFVIPEVGGWTAADPAVFNITLNGDLNASSVIINQTRDTVAVRSQTRLSLTGFSLDTAQRRSVRFSIPIVRTAQTNDIIDVYLSKDGETGSQSIDSASTAVLVDAIRDEIERQIADTVNFPTLGEDINQVFLGGSLNETVFIDWNTTSDTEVEANRMVTFDYGTDPLPPTTNIFGFNAGAGLQLGNVYQAGDNNQPYFGEDQIVTAPTGGSEGEVLVRQADGSFAFGDNETPLGGTEDYNITTSSGTTLGTQSLTVVFPDPDIGAEFFAFYDRVTASGDISTISFTTTVDEGMPTERVVTVGPYDIINVTSTATTTATVTFTGESQLPDAVTIDPNDTGVISVPYPDNSILTLNGTQVGYSTALFDLPTHRLTVDKLAIAVPDTETPTHLLGYDDITDNVVLTDLISSIDDLSDVDITTTAPSAGQVLKWDAANNIFIPADETGGGGGPISAAGIDDAADPNEGEIVVIDPTLNELRRTPPIDRHSTTRLASRIDIVEHELQTEINAITQFNSQLAIEPISNGVFVPGKVFFEFDGTLRDGTTTNDADLGHYPLPTGVTFVRDATTNDIVGHQINRALYFAEGVTQHRDTPVTGSQDRRPSEDDTPIIGEELLAAYNTLTTLQQAAMTHFYILPNSDLTGIEVGSKEPPGGPDDSIDLLQCPIIIEKPDNIGNPSDIVRYNVVNGRYPSTIETSNTAVFFLNVDPAVSTDIYDLLQAQTNRIFFFNPVDIRGDLESFNTLLSADRDQRITFDDHVDNNIIIDEAVVGLEADNPEITSIFGTFTYVQADMDTQPSLTDTITTYQQVDLPADNFLDNIPITLTTYTVPLTSPLFGPTTAQNDVITLTIDLPDIGELALTEHIGVDIFNRRNARINLRGFITSVTRVNNRPTGEIQFRVLENNITFDFAAGSELIVELSPEYPYSFNIPSTSVDQGFITGLLWAPFFVGSAAEYTSRIENAIYIIQFGKPLLITAAHTITDGLSKGFVRDNITFQEGDYYINKGTTPGTLQWEKQEHGYETNHRTEYHYSTVDFTHSIAAGADFTISLRLPIRGELPLSTTTGVGFGITLYDPATPGAENLKGYITAVAAMGMTGGVSPVPTQPITVVVTENNLSVSPNDGTVLIAEITSDIAYGETVPDSIEGYVSGRTLHNVLQDQQEVLPHFELTSETNPASITVLDLSEEADAGIRTMYNTLGGEMDIQYDRATEELQFLAHSGDLAHLDNDRFYFTLTGDTSARQLQATSVTNVDSSVGNSIQVITGSLNSHDANYLENYVHTHPGFGYTGQLGHPAEQFKLFFTADEMDPKGRLTDPNYEVTGSIVSQELDGQAPDDFAKIKQLTTGGPISIDALTDVDTTTTPPTSGQVLNWDGTNWVPISNQAGTALSDESLEQQDRATTTITAMDASTGDLVMTLSSPAFSRLLPEYAIRRMTIESVAEGPYTVPDFTLGTLDDTAFTITLEGLADPAATLTAIDALFPTATPPTVVLCVWYTYNEPSANVIEDRSLSLVGEIHVDGNITANCIRGHSVDIRSLDDTLLDTTVTGDTIGTLSISRTAGATNLLFPIGSFVNTPAIGDDLFAEGIDAAGLYRMISGPNTLASFVSVGITRLDDAGNPIGGGLRETLDAGTVIVRRNVTMTENIVPSINVFTATGDFISSAVDVIRLTELPDAASPTVADIVGRNADGELVIINQSFLPGAGGGTTIAGGTDGQIPKFNALGNNIEDSQINDDGTNVSITSLANPTQSRVIVDVDGNLTTAPDSSVVAPHFDKTSETTGQVAFTFTDSDAYPFVGNQQVTQDVRFNTLNGQLIGTVTDGTDFAINDPVSFQLVDSGNIQNQVFEGSVVNITGNVITIQVNHHDENDLEGYTYGHSFGIEGRYSEADERAQLFYDHTEFTLNRKTVSPKYTASNAVIAQTETGEELDDLAKLFQVFQQGGYVNAWITGDVASNQVTANVDGAASEFTLETYTNINGVTQTWYFYVDVTLTSESSGFLTGDGIWSTLLETNTALVFNHPSTFYL